MEQLGQAPDPNKMPLEVSDFPEDVQVAFFIFNILSNRISDSSGIFMGKYWEQFPYYCTMYQVHDEKWTLQILKHYEGLLVEKSVKEYQAKMEKEKQVQKNTGGKSSVYDVRG